ncbi:MAG: LysR family transcriptional regulator [Betaproteobacteria bacterium]|nr:MAG: LysR family transcriptional regulator [Betaproteobacteria bacterium]
MTPRISLEQWQALVAVVDAGGYAQAAERLHKSQSSVTYLVQKLESLLDVKAFEIKGRKAALTPTGEMLYRRARTLLEEAAGLEKTAKSASAGWEAEIRVAAEIVFPAWLLLKCFERLNAESPHTRIEYFESVIAGTNELLLAGRADLAITTQIPQGFTGALLMPLRMILVAHPQHPLHRLGRPLTMRDLRAQRQLVIRETDALRATKTSIEATQRWTVSHISTAIFAAGMGFGYGWYPEERIRAELYAGSLKPLPLREGAERVGQLYLVYADRENAGPGTLRLAEIIREIVKSECASATSESKQQS